MNVISKEGNLLTSLCDTWKNDIMSEFLEGRRVEVEVMSNLLCNNRRVTGSDRYRPLQRGGEGVKNLKLSFKEW